MNVAVKRVNLARRELYCFHLKKYKRQLLAPRAIRGLLEEQAIIKNKQQQIENKNNFFLVALYPPQNIGTKAAAKEPKRIAWLKVVAVLISPFRKIILLLPRKEKRFLAKKNSNIAKGKRAIIQ